jgi:hypothetical protein
MLRTLSLSLALLPLVAQAQAGGRRLPAEVSSHRDSAIIARLEQRIETGVVRRDVAFLDSVYAPSFRFKHSTGDVETRAQRLASLRTPQVSGAPGRTVSRDVDSIEVEVHGNVALTTGRIHVVRNGGDLHWQNYTIRYVRIYARAAAAPPWRLVTHHSTSDAQGAPSAFGLTKP